MADIRLYQDYRLSKWTNREIRSDVAVICTIGPAQFSDLGARIRELAAEGMNVARINLSHYRLDKNGRADAGGLSQLVEIVRSVRKASDELNRPVGVMLDLKGPEIRVAGFTSPGPDAPETGSALSLQPGMELDLTSRPDYVSNGTAVVRLAYDGDFEQDIASQDPRDPLFIDNGGVELELLEAAADHARVRVRYGETIGLRKGMNLFNNVRPSAGPPVSDIDRAYLEALLADTAEFRDACPVDAVAVSFTRSRADLASVRAVLEQWRPADAHRIKLIAKVESPHCFMKTADGNPNRFDPTRLSFDRYENILTDPLCWAVMVARGDLGVEIAPEQVARVQRGLSSRANHAGKAVIVATQLLMSMLDKRRPSRADVTDIYDAVLGGADALMLSEETAVGRFPVESLSMMRKVAGTAALELVEPREHESYLRKMEDAAGPSGSATVTGPLGRPVYCVAQESGSPVVFSYAITGRTLTQIPRYRLSRPLVAVASDEVTARNLLFYFGVHPLVVTRRDSSGTILPGFDFPRNVKEFRDFLRSIVRSAQDTGNRFRFPELEETKPEQMLVGLFGVDEKSALSAARAVVIFRY